MERRKALMFLLAAAATVNMGLFWNAWKEKEVVLEKQQNLERIAFPKEEASFCEKEKFPCVEGGSTEQYYSPVDFEALKQINQDIAGWMEIPGTEISMPIVQGRDNEQYMGQNFYGERSREGTAFLDYRSDKELEGKFHPVYGHHMKNGTMFTFIKQYVDPRYCSEYPIMHIYTPKQQIRLWILGAWEGDGETEISWKELEQSENLENIFLEKLDMPEFCLERFQEQRKKPGSKNQSWYLFVTCSYGRENGRLYLAAVPL